MNMDRLPPTVPAPPGSLPSRPLPVLRPLILPPVSHWSAAGKQGAGQGRDKPIWRNPEENFDRSITAPLDEIHLLSCPHCYKASCWCRFVCLVETIPKSGQTTGQSVTRVSYSPINWTNFPLESHFVIGAGTQGPHFLTQ